MRLRNPKSKELDRYFLPILKECREFLTLHAYKIIYEELREALPIHDIAKIRIVATEDLMDSTRDVLYPCFTPINEDRVIFDIHRH